MPEQRNMFCFFFFVPCRAANHRCAHTVPAKGLLPAVLTSFSGILRSRGLPSMLLPGFAAKPGLQLPAMFWCATSTPQHPPRAPR